LFEFLAYQTLCLRNLVQSHRLLPFRIEFTTKTLISLFIQDILFFLLLQRTYMTTFLELASQTFVLYYFIRKARELVHQSQQVLSFDFPYFSEHFGHRIFIPLVFVQNISNPEITAFYENLKLSVFVIFDLKQCHSPLQNEICVQSRLFLLVDFITFV